MQKEEADGFSGKRRQRGKWMQALKQRDEGNGGAAVKERVYKKRNRSRRRKKEWRAARKERG